MTAPLASATEPHAASAVRSAEGADDSATYRGHRAATWLMLLVGLVVLYYVGRVLLLAFAGTLLAVLLNGVSQWIADRTGLSYGWSLALVVITLLVAFGLAVWRLQAVVTEQVQQFSEALPQSIESLRGRLEQAGMGGMLPTKMPTPADVAQQPGMWGRLTGLASGTLAAGVELLVILFVGLYGAVEPRLYQRGVRHLVPKPRRERADQVLCVLGSTLRWWSVAMLASMAIVGTAIGVGLGLLGIEMALLLGIIAALLELIPNFGPIIAAVPAILIASSQSSQLALYVVLLFVIVQFAESYLVVPLVQRQTVHTPPALVILAIVLMGTLAGALGALLATPLIAVAIVLVKMLYVEDRLGDTSIEVDGESACGSGDPGRTA